MHLSSLFFLSCLKAQWILPVIMKKKPRQVSEWKLPGITVLSILWEYLKWIPYGRWPSFVLLLPWCLRCSDPTLLWEVSVLHKGPETPKIPWSWKGPALPALPALCLQEQDLHIPGDVLLWGHTGLWGPAWKSVGYLQSGQKLSELSLILKENQIH